MHAGLQHGRRRLLLGPEHLHHPHPHAPPEELLLWVCLLLCVYGSACLLFWKLFHPFGLQQGFVLLLFVWPFFGGFCVFVLFFFTSVCVWLCESCLVCLVSLFEKVCWFLSLCHVVFFGHIVRRLPSLWRFSPDHPATLEGSPVPRGVGGVQPELQMIDLRLAADSPAVNETTICGIRAVGGWRRRRSPSICSVTGAEQQLEENFRELQFTVLDTRCH